MSPISQELLIDFAELRRIGVKCSEPSCHAEVIFDVSDSVNGIPSRCACGKEYEPLFRSTLDSYRDFYKAFSKSKHSIKAHVASPAQSES